MDSTTITRAIVIATYFLIVLVLGFLARSRTRETPGQYFLADRNLGAFVLVLTMTATNFSAFTIFGVSGAGYRDGFAFFPIMGFGTGFMALTFWLIGRKTWELGKKHGLITPAELVCHLYGNSTLLNLIFALVLIVFTAPYLAIQPMAGANVLNGLFNIPLTWGAIIITAIIMAYTLRGGMKAVAWTDVFQGLFMVTLMIIALAIVVGYHGGLTTGLQDLKEFQPDLFSRPGLSGKYVPAMWFSFIALWFFCDPMFPQLFQRFFASKDEKALATTTLLYPVICTVVFFIPVTIGVLGHLHPSIASENPDNVMTLLMTEIGGDLMGTLVLAAGLAALMSTMDSQLLTLSSIFTRDILPIFGFKIRGDESDESGRKKTMIARLFVLGLAVAGVLIALNALKNEGNIVDLAVKHAFTGLAVLFPTVLFGLFLPNPRPLSAILSIVVGEALVIMYAIPSLSLPAWGYLPAIPVIAASFLIYILVQGIMDPGSFSAVARISTRTLLYTAGFILIFILAMDFWNWGKSTPGLFGIPGWVYWFVGLSAIQTILTWFMLKPVFNRAS